MALYCGIDLHSNHYVIAVIDDEDRRPVEARLPNDLTATPRLLQPCRGALAGIVVESTVNGYWRVDSLMDHGYRVKLANTVAIKPCGA
jgi:transposase